MSRPYTKRWHSYRRRSYDKPAVVIQRRESYSTCSSETGSEYSDECFGIVNDPRIIELPRGYNLRVPLSGRARRDIVISPDDYYKDEPDPIVIVEREEPHTRRSKSYSYRRRVSTEEPLSLDDVRKLAFDKSSDHEDFDEELRELRRRRLERVEEELLESEFDRDWVFGSDRKLAKRRWSLRKQLERLEEERSWAARMSGHRSVREIQMDLDRCNRELRECRAQMLRLQNPRSRSYP